MACSLWGLALDPEEVAKACTSSLLHNKELHEARWFNAVFLFFVQVFFFKLWEFANVHRATSWGNIYIYIYIHIHINLYYIYLTLLHVSCDFYLQVRTLNPQEAMLIRGQAQLRPDAQWICPSWHLWRCCPRCFRRRKSLLSFLLLLLLLLLLLWLLLWLLLLLLLLSFFLLVMLLMVVVLLFQWLWPCAKPPRTGFLCSLRDGLQWRLESHSRQRDLAAMPWRNQVVVKFLVGTL